MKYALFIPVAVIQQMEGLVLSITDVLRFKSGREMFTGFTMPTITSEGLDLDKG